MGEALAVIRDHEPAVLDFVSSWRAIIGMRNIIIHAYSKIDPSLLRGTIERDVPLLIEEIDALLA